MKVGDYANGRTFIGWHVRLWQSSRELRKHSDGRTRCNPGVSVSCYCDTLEEAKSRTLKGRFKKKIRRMYRKDSPMRAALRALVEAAEAARAGKPCWRDTIETAREFIGRWDPDLEIMLGPKPEGKAAPVNTFYTPDGKEPESWKKR